MSPQNNRINLVNNADEIIGEGDKNEVHLGNGLLHQAISLFLFCKESDDHFKLLMQQRSEKKIVGASQWANTVCGNVAVGETHRECTVRRLREELGLNLPADLEHKLQEITVFKYQVQCNEKYSENEIDHIFAFVINGDDFNNLNLQLNSDEVTSAAWVDWPIKDLGVKKITPWFQMFLNSPQVMGAINKFLRKERV